jgi:lipopolysaccharide transport system ATP-binding protein
MNDTVIRVGNLSKQYRIGAARPRYDTFRDVLAEAYVRSVRKVAGVFTKGERPEEAVEANTIWALKDVSLEITRGEAIGFVGANGAGKSTFLKILSRITEPTAGFAEIHGRVGSLLEVGTGFHGELTGRENVYLNGAILGMRKSEIERKFEEIVEFAEVAKFIDTPVKRYSSGMYVRLAFAVAAHLQADILIIDEVFAVGDSAFQRKCLGKMGDMVGTGRTVLFVSHNMAAIQSLCSKCFLLRHGRVVAEGPPRSIVESYLADGVTAVAAPIRERKDRKGSGAIRFVESLILNADGKPIEMALSGQDIAIALTYCSKDERPISRLDVHITFYTLRGQFMFTCSSEAHGTSFDGLPPRGQVICQIPDLPIAPGRYMFNLYSTIKGETADWVEHAGYLEVGAGDFFGTGQLVSREGGFLVRHDWATRSTTMDLSRGSA